MAAWTGYDTTFLPAMFEMNIPTERSKNTYVMKERKRESVVVRDGALGKRKREKGEFSSVCVVVEWSGVVWY